MKKSCHTFLSMCDTDFFGTIIRPITNLIHKPLGSESRAGASTINPSLREDHPLIITALPCVANCRDQQAKKTLIFLFHAVIGEES
jgi:hypothetical protein